MEPVWCSYLPDVMGSTVTHYLPSWLSVVSWRHRRLMSATIYKCINTTQNKNIFPTCFTSLKPPFILSHLFGITLGHTSNLISLYTNPPTHTGLPLILKVQSTEYITPPPPYYNKICESDIPSCCYI